MAFKQYKALKDYEEKNENVEHAGFHPEGSLLFVNDDYANPLVIGGTIELVTTTPEDKETATAVNDELEVEAKKDWDSKHEKKEEAAEEEVATEESETVEETTSEEEVPVEEETITDETPAEETATEETATEEPAATEEGAELPTEETPVEEVAPTEEEVA